MHHHLIPALIAVVALCTILTAHASAADAPADGSIRVYLASPAETGGGIFLSTLDGKTGELATPVAIAATPSSFLALAPDQRRIYAVGNIKLADGKQDGVVRALEVNRISGALRLLNEQPSGGRGPCHVTVDPPQKNVLVANYSGGTFSVLPLESNGQLRAPSTTITHTGTGPNVKRQKEPHPHSCNLDPSGKLAMIADLGIDKVMLYRLDAATGAATPAEPTHIPTPPGGGPRHLDFHPSNKWLYVNNEMGCSVTVFSIDGEGKFSEVQTIATLPDGHKESDTTSEVQVHPSGKFLYVATRGANQMTAYAIDQSNGKLTLIGLHPSEGDIPRHFAIDPTGRWLLVANQKGNKVAVLKIDEASGALSSTGKSVELPTPMCVLFYPN